MSCYCIRLGGTYANKFQVLVERERLRVSSTIIIYKFALFDCHCFNLLDIPSTRRFEQFVERPEWWECDECIHLLYFPFSFAYAYYSSIAVFGNHNNLRFWGAATEHSVFCLISFVASAFYGRTRTDSADFCSVEDFCQGAISLPLPQGVLELIQDTGCFETFLSCAFDISQAHLTLHRTFEVRWNNDSNVGWFAYCAGDGIVSDIPDRNVPGRKSSLNDKVISVHVNIVKVSFLVVQFCTLADPWGASKAALRPSQENEEQELGTGEDDIEEALDVSDLRWGSERGPSAFKHVKSLCESLSLPVPTTVVKAEKWIEDVIRVFAEYSQLKALLKTTIDILAAAQEDWEQRTAVYRKEWADLVTQVEDKSLYISKTMIFLLLFQV